MRVAIDYTPALRQGAGIGRYTRGLVAGLAGSTTRTATPSSAPGSAQHSAGPRTSRCAALASLRAGSLRHGIGCACLFRTELLAGRCDIYHSPDFTLPPLFRGLGSSPCMIFPFCGCPNALTHACAPSCERAVPPAVQRAQRVLADSESTRADLIALLAVPAAKISVVMPGVESRFHRIDDAALLTQVRDRYRLPAHFFLGIGTLEPRKNFARLVSAFAALRRATACPTNWSLRADPAGCTNRYMNACAPRAWPSTSSCPGSSPMRTCPRSTIWRTH